MNIKLRELIDIFILENEIKGNSIKTINQYKSTLCYFADYVEEHLIENITIDIIKQYQKNLLERDYIGNSLRKGKDGQKLSKTTVNSYMTPVRTFFIFLYDNNYIEQNIFEKISIVKKSKQIKEILSEEQIEDVLLSFSDSELKLRNKIIFLLMVDSGLRLSELKRIRIHDLVLTSNLIKINDAKGNKDRYVPMSLSLKKAIYKYITLYRSAPDSIDVDYLLLNKSKEQMTDKAVESVIKRIRYKMGYKKFSPHMLRHTFATRYIINGGDMFSLQLILGHEDLQTVRKYVHLANYYMTSNYSKISTVDRLLKNNSNIKI